ncbi:Exodeoxyribonuclease VII large subunit [Gracilibacillus ureilyticus]|uniref:Exodeoxyribonuclease 7 large subunit n=1 Tax=Gracilibacillus ureilyticus TaxID=531814 RepID=A0A1H9LWV3_9BACI|nr:exodeoxyribonuclease VII large subunit [Gracilibacillus ureilyticus]SER15911.1 Exodeoxyribonuclease VII large subunit [Gracilibacillus ureilyticus]
MEDKYLSVTALTRYIKKKFDVDKHLSNIWLRGEISNFKHHSRGHMYMTIKDDNASIRAVMFQSQNMNMDFKPEDGMKVLLLGNVSVFESSGQYQLYIQEMQPDGIGALHLAFEQLKEKLEKEGIFDQQHKKEIPEYPEKIAVLTSPTGAAVRDILTTLERRYPLVNVLVVPILVQGKYAKDSIAEAINKTNSLKGIDLIILGRGGGSIEELWAFNEEKVARAIFQSSIPIISAVGHETDFTISDFAADVRAATPTAAAEIAVPSRKEIMEYVQQLNRMLTNNHNRYIHHQKQDLKRLQESYAFKYPKRFITEKEQILDRLIERKQLSINRYAKEKWDKWKYADKQLEYINPEKIIHLKEEKLKSVHNQLVQQGNHLIEKNKSKFSHQLSQLELLNPMNIMLRGYSIAYNENEDLITKASEVKVGDNFTVQLADGKVFGKVKNVEGNNNG